MPSLPASARSQILRRSAFGRPDCARATRACAPVMYPLPLMSTSSNIRLNFSREFGAMRNGSTSTSLRCSERGDGKIPTCSRCTEDTDGNRGRSGPPCVPAVENPCALIEAVMLTIPSGCMTGVLQTLCGPGLMLPKVELSPVLVGPNVPYIGFTSDSAENFGNGNTPCAAATTHLKCR
jgi:hypothetical protein